MKYFLLLLSLLTLGLGMFSLRGTSRDDVAGGISDGASSDFFKKNHSHDKPDTVTTKDANDSSSGNGNRNENSDNDRKHEGLKQEDGTTSNK